jgi:hypothetical protein
MIVEELLARVLVLDEAQECLTPEARRAFRQWQDEERTSLSPKQEHWLRGVAERLGIEAAPSENLFSQLSPKRQAEQRKAAERVVLPWERKP